MARTVRALELTYLSGGTTMLYDVLVYDGQDSERRAAVLSVARTRIAGELRAVEKRLGQRMAFAVVQRWISPSSSEMMVAGAAVRRASGWVVEVTR